VCSSVAAVEALLQLQQLQQSYICRVGNSHCLKRQEENILKHSRATRSIYERVCMLPSASDAARTHTERKAVDTGVRTYDLEIVIVKICTGTNPRKASGIDPY